MQENVLNNLNKQLLRVTFISLFMKAFDVSKKNRISCKLKSEVCLKRLCVYSSDFGKKMYFPPFC